MKKTIPQSVFDSKEAELEEYEAKIAELFNLSYRLDSGNPNHPDNENKIFDYPEKEFMKKTIPQSVFDSKEAKTVIKNGTKSAILELNLTPCCQLDPGNPNHPDYGDKIFGYPEKEFLEKQYRK
jgi:hypothetical protein